VKKSLTADNEYRQWLAEIKAKVRQTQLKASLKVNAELLNFYWELGADIVIKQKTAKWGSKLLSQLSRDLMAEFPEMKGFSTSNLKYIKQWYLFYSKGTAIGQQVVGQLQSDKIGQQVVAQITNIPWGHNIAIIAKCKDVKEALYYAENTMLHNHNQNPQAFVWTATPEAIMKKIVKCKEALGTLH